MRIKSCALSRAEFALPSPLACGYLSLLKNALPGHRSVPGLVHILGVDVYTAAYPLMAAVIIQLAAQIAEQGLQAAALTGL